MTADEVREGIAEAAAAFSAAVEQRDFESTTPAGWTVKEMVAHVAFWLETTPPFVSGAFRGDVTAFDVTFPSGYSAPDDGSWPAADAHNEREAAWARQQTAETVTSRLEDAIRNLQTFLSSVTDSEAAERADYYRDIGSHLDAHREELAGA
jgi:hypothetical protein